MRKTILSFLFSFIALIGFAQQKDPKAKVILDEVSNKFKTYQSVTSDFAYQLLNASGKVIATQSGKIYLKGDKFNITWGNNKMISDGKTVWNYDSEFKEVTINNVESNATTITPKSLLSDFYNKDFMYVLGNDTKVGNRSANVVILQPIDKGKPISRMYLAIDKINKNVLSATVIEKSGNKYVYSLSGLKPNVALPDSQFSFDKSDYPGVEIVDLR